MNAISKDKIFYIIAGVLALIVVLILVFLYKVQTDLNKNLFNQNSPTQIPKDATNDEVILKSIKFDDKSIVTYLAVEFLDKPILRGQTYIARATVPLGNQTTEFDVILGGSDGQVRSGSCGYIKSNSTFDGNDIFFIENTTALAEKIKPGVKALLRVYHTDGSLEEKTKPALIALRLISLAVINNTKLDGAVHIVPDEFCIANPK